MYIQKNSSTAISNMYEDVYHIILLKSWNQPEHPSLGELIICATCKPWNIRQLESEK